MPCHASESCSANRAFAKSTNGTLSISWQGADPIILLRTEPRRYYPYAELAAHVLGFVGLDNTGQAGVEYSFDQDVQGQAGLARVQVDAHGRRLDTVVERPPVPGAAVRLPSRQPAKRVRQAAKNQVREV